MQKRREPASYQLFLIDQHGGVAGHAPLEATSDREAELAGWLIFEPCVDACATFQIWNDRRCIVFPQAEESRPGPTAAEISRALVDLTLQSEESLADSRHAIARSRSLLQRLGRAPESDASRPQDLG